MAEGMDLFAAFATDEAKENEGVEVPIGAGTKLKIARAGNANFEKALQAELDTHRMALDTLPEAERKALDAEIYKRVVAGTILVGWSGVKYKGKELKYNVENAIMLLGMKDFRGEVMRHAQNMALYRAKAEAADEKN